METPSLRQPDLIGRDDELAKLKSSLDNAHEGRGSTIFVAGEAGIGKTRIVNELISHAESKGTQIMKGWCLAESLEPLLPVKTALREVGLFHLISGSPPPKVISTYLMNENGMLLAKAEREEMGIDPDIFTGMLQAVGNFVQDSLSIMSEEGKGGLNTLGFQDHTILIQTHGTLSLAAVIKGEKCEFLVEDMKHLLAETGDKFRDWEGDMDATQEIQPKVTWFVESGKYDGKFLVDDPKIKQENLFDNVLLGIQRASVEKPLLLFLDDLQWSDPTTLNLLHYLSRNTRKNRILMLGTYRPEDIIESEEGKPHQLKTTMQNMSREDLFKKIELMRLGPDETRKIIRSALNNDSFQDDFFIKTYKETEGAPFFILEVMKLLIDNKTISQDEEGIWNLVTDIETLDIPSKVYDVIKRRLDRLKREQKEILECASVIGEEFESEIIGNAIGIDKFRLLKDLSEIEKSHQLVHYLPDKYRFDHAKVKEVLYYGIGEELRKEYHRIIGDTIGDLNKDAPDEIVNVLAYHYHEAGDERAGEYLVQAGDMAKDRYANEEAVSLYRNALKVLEDDERMRNTYENLGEVYSLTAEFASAIDNYNSALKMEKDNKKKAIIHKKIAGVYSHKGDFQKSKEVCQSGLKLLKNEECLESAQLLESQGWAYVRMGDYENASELLGKSLRIAQGLHNKKAIAKAYHTIGSTNLNKGEFDDALKHLEMALKIRKEIDDARGQSASLNNTGVVYWNKGEIDKAREYYERSLEIDEKIGNKWGISTALNNIGLVHSEKGELDKALEHYGQTLEIDEKIGDKSGIASVLNNIGNIYNRKGEMDKALEIHRRSLGLRENIGDKTGIAHSLINIGNSYKCKGETEKALEHFNRSLDIGVEIGDKWLLGHIYFSLAESILELGDVEKALENAEKGLELSARIGAKREEGMCHQALGMIYREKGEWSRSIESFETAVEILEEAKDKNVLARVFYEYGLMWKAKGEPGKAGDLIGKALELSEEMGMELWAEKCRKALGE